MTTTTRRRWAAAIAAAAAVAGLAGCGTTAAPHQAPAHSSPAVAAQPSCAARTRLADPGYTAQQVNTLCAAEAGTGPSAPLDPQEQQAVALSVWWATSGHRDTAAVQADLLKITGDFRTADPAAALATDGQQLADDAQAASAEQVAAMNAEAPSDPGGWTGPQAAQVFADYSAAMGQLGAAGEGLVGGATQFDTQAGAADLASVNATIAAFGLQPAGPGSIDSPNA